MSHTPQSQVAERIRYLREETDFLLTVFEALTEYAVIAFDFDGFVLAYNEGARALYGHAPEEVVGRLKIEDLFPPGFGRDGGLHDQVRRLLDGGRVTFNTRMARKNGQTFPAHVHLVLTHDRNQHVVGFVAIVQDLTERLRAEAVIKRAGAQSLLAHLVENARYEMIFVVSAEGRVLESNAVARDTFLWSQAQMRVADMDNLFAFGAGRRWAEVAEHVATEGHWRGNLTAFRRGGTSFPVDMTVSRPPGEERMIAVVRDVSREQEIDRMKSEFIAIASHELRSPLTSIKNAVEILLGRKAGPLIDAQEQFLHIAERNIDRLGRLVGDLLDLSKIEAGQTRLALAPLHAGPVVERVVTALSPAADKKGVRLRAVVPGDLPPCFADAGRIEQVLTNLGDNAIKFTPARGTVTFRAGRPEDAAGDDHMLEFSVADTGVGVPPEQVEHLFERFYQAETTLSGEQRAGFGLGLAICKEIVESHGGAIGVERRPEGGTTFRFTLPMAGPEAGVLRRLNALIASAARRDAPVSVLVIRGADPEAAGGGDAVPDPDEVNLALKQVVTRLHLRRSDALESCLDRGEVVVTLPDTGREGVEVVRGRVEPALRDVAAARGRPILAIGFATFPKDGADAATLLERARRIVAAPDGAGGRT